MQKFDRRTGEALDLYLDTKIARLPHSSSFKGPTCEPSDNPGINGSKSDKKSPYLK
jgi:hypothetical protein